MLTYSPTEYLTDRALTASPMELIRMLYEGAISSIERAVEMLHTGDIMARGQAITKAINIIHELRAALDTDRYPEYASTMLELYIFMQNRLTEAHARQSEEALQEVSRLLRRLLENWTAIMHQVAEADSESHPDEPPSEWSTLPSHPYATGLAAATSSRTWQA